jgi:hypothetical protein
MISSGRWIGFVAAIVLKVLRVGARKFTEFLTVFAAVVAEDAETESIPLDLLVILGVAGGVGIIMVVLCACVVCLCIYLKKLNFQ